jgi:hypothetical protein
VAATAEDQVLHILETYMHLAEEQVVTEVITLADLVQTAAAAQITQVVEQVLYKLLQLDWVLAERQYIMADIEEVIRLVGKQITILQLAAAAVLQDKVEMVVVLVILLMQVQEVGDTFQISKVETTPMVLAEQVELILVDKVMAGN